MLYEVVMCFLSYLPYGSFNYLTTWSRVIENSMVSHLIKKYHLLTYADG